MTLVAVRFGSPLVSARHEDASRVARIERHADVGIAARNTDRVTAQIDAHECGALVGMSVALAGTESMRLPGVPPGPVSS